jgi:hypothetical protein
MFQHVIDQARSHGIGVIGCTLPPGGWQDKGTESVRSAVNTWMRSSGDFEHLVDFDTITRDPAQPDKMVPELTIGSTAMFSPGMFSDRGHKALADAMDLFWFVAK